MIFTDLFKSNNFHFIFREFRQERTNPRGFNFYQFQITNFLFPTQICSSLTTFALFFVSSVRNEQIRVALIFTNYKLLTFILHTDLLKSNNFRSIFREFRQERTNPRGINFFTRELHLKYCHKSKISLSFFCVFQRNQVRLLN